MALGPLSSGPGPTRVIGVSSGKGGVGKSSVTVNVAVALAGAGHSVGILDADVYGFSVPAMLGLAGTPTTSGGLTMSDGKVQPPTAFGVRVMSMGFFANEDQPVIWRGPMLHKALEQFLADVDWGSPDFLLVDMPPGTGDVALSMSQYLPASEVYVVTTPQVAAKRVAQRSAYMARKLNLPLRGVIENMSWFSGPDGSRYEIFGKRWRRPARRGAWCAASWPESPWSRQYARAATRASRSSWPSRPPKLPKRSSRSRARSWSSAGAGSSVRSCASSEAPAGCGRRGRATVAPGWREHEVSARTRRWYRKRKAHRPACRFGHGRHWCAGGGVRGAGRRVGCRCAAAAQFGQPAPGLPT